MPERSSFFNSFEGDRRYTAAEFVEYFSDFIGNGIYFGGSNLKVSTAGGMDISIAVGKAFINGYRYTNETVPKLITILPAHATLPRIDKVVLRLDLAKSKRLISAIVLTGSPAAVPVAPTILRDNATWDLALADIRINAAIASVQQSNITDLRLNKDLCGVVTGVVEQPNLTDIFNQYQDKYNEVNTHWRNWFGMTQSEWTAWFLSSKNSWNGWFNQIKAEIYAQANTDFEDYSRRAGYTRLTAFNADESILETIKNTLNNVVFATRRTVFTADNKIITIISFTSPALSVKSTTTFNSDGSISEIYEENGVVT